MTKYETILQIFISLSRKYISAIFIRLVTLQFSSRNWDEIVETRQDKTFLLKLSKLLSENEKLDSNYNIFENLERLVKFRSYFYFRRIDRRRNINCPCLFIDTLWTLVTFVIHDNSTVFPTLALKSSHAYWHRTNHLHPSLLFFGTTDRH